VQEFPVEHGGEMIALDQQVYGPAIAVHGRRGARTLDAFASGPGVGIIDERRRRWWPFLAPLAMIGLDQLQQTIRQEQPSRKAQLTRRHAMKLGEQTGRARQRRPGGRAHPEI